MTSLVESLVPYERERQRAAHASANGNGAGPSVDHAVKVVERLLYEKSVPGRRSFSLGDLDVRATGSQFRGPAQTLEEAERAHIVATLTDTNWVVAGARGAAARLGMNRSTLQFKMKKLGIVPPRM